MYSLNHDGESIGITHLERGDPAELAVSGAFSNMGGAKALAGWIKSVGGGEDDGVVFIELDDAFSLVDEDGNTIKYAEGHLIAVPKDDEAFLDLVGISEQDYKTYFADHLSAMNKNS